MKNTLSLICICLCLQNVFAQNTIQEIQYWIDEDYDSAVSIDYNSSLASLQQVYINSQSPGLHRLHIRSKDDEGNWSSIYSRSFQTSNPNRIIGYRYFLDADQTQEHNASISPPVSVLEMNELNMAPLIQEDYHLHFQFLDELGAWSSLYDGGSFEYLGPDSIVGLFEFDILAYEQLDISPNPSNVNSQISYNLLSSGHVQFKLFSKNAQLIKSESLGQKASGKHFYSLDLNDLSSGIYFIQIDSETQHQIGKLLVE